MHEAGAAWEGLQSFPGLTQQLIPPKPPPRGWRTAPGAPQGHLWVGTALIPKAQNCTEQALLLLRAPLGPGAPQSPNCSSGVQPGPPRHLELQTQPPEPIRARVHYWCCYGHFSIPTLDYPVYTQLPKSDGEFRTNARCQAGAEARAGLCATTRTCQGLGSPPVPHRTPGKPPGTTIISDFCPWRLGMGAAILTKAPRGLG